MSQKVCKYFPKRNNFLPVKYERGFLRKEIFIQTSIYVYMFAVWVPLSHIFNFIVHYLLTNAHIYVLLWMQTMAVFILNSYMYICIIIFKYISNEVDTLDT